jgi:hypothetical protein
VIIDKINNVDLREAGAEKSKRQAKNNSEPKKSKGMEI